ncbi:hypothetical protein HDU67_007912 [Dinochytrium kinnereticum]|nr:hypothetical protein HDU67_007912 [Dinochytrium kinnereticum]
MSNRHLHRETTQAAVGGMAASSMAPISALKLPSLETIPTSHFPSVLTHAALDIDCLTFIGDSAGAIAPDDGDWADRITARKDHPSSSGDSSYSGAIPGSHSIDVDDLLKSADNIAVSDINGSTNADQVDVNGSSQRQRPVSDGSHIRRRRLNSLSGISGLLRANANMSPKSGAQSKKRFSFMDSEFARQREAWSSDVSSPGDAIAGVFLLSESTRDIDEFLIDQHPITSPPLQRASESAPHLRTRTRSDLDLPFGMARDALLVPMALGEAIDHPSSFDVDSLLGLADEFSAPVRTANEKEKVDIAFSSSANLSRSNHWVTYNWSHVDLAGREYGLPETGFMYRPWTREGWTASDIEGLMQIGVKDSPSGPESDRRVQFETPLAPDLAIEIQEIRIQSHSIPQKASEKPSPRREMKEKEEAKLTAKDTAGREFVMDSEPATFRDRNQAQIRQGRQAESCRRGISTDLFGVAAASSSLSIAQRTGSSKLMLHNLSLPALFFPFPSSQDPSALLSSASSDVVIMPTTLRISAARTGAEGLDSVEDLNEFPPMSAVYDLLDIDSFIGFGEQPAMKRHHKLSASIALQDALTRNVQPTLSQQDVSDLLSIGESATSLFIVPASFTNDSTMSKVALNQSNSYINTAKAMEREDTGNDDVVMDIASSSHAGRNVGRRFSDTPLPAKPFENRRSDEWVTDRRDSQTQLLKATNTRSPSLHVLDKAPQTSLAFPRPTRRAISASTPALPAMGAPEKEIKKTRGIYGSVDNLFMRKDRLSPGAVVRVAGVSWPGVKEADKAVTQVFTSLDPMSRGKQPHSIYSHQYSLIEHPSLPIRFLVCDCPTNESLLGDYLPVFQEQNVKVLIRLCDPDVYDPSPLSQAGIIVKDDLAFEDGTVPAAELVENYRTFISSLPAGSASSAVAVHCVSGIGRAPILVAIAMIDAGIERLDAVEMIRSKRRGAFNKRQLEWILDSKGGLTKAGAKGKKLGGGKLLGLFKRNGEVAVTDALRCILSVYKGGASPNPMIVFHHGGGHTAETWHLAATHLLKELECTVVMYDCRGHGRSESSDETDFSLKKLSNDLAEIIKNVSGDTNPEVVLVGHSLGAAVVVEAATTPGMIKNIAGVVAVDVVEGTALESLQYMRSVIRSRPMSFKTIEDCISWSIKSHYIRNAKIAPLLIPPQLKKVDDAYVWRMDLTKTERFWNEWFTNLSEKFLSVKAGRLLVLAGTDRLDKPLTIAQMQGKFQMVVYPECGHSVHEEEPEKFARLLIEFYKRNQRNIVIKRFPIPLKK